MMWSTTLANLKENLNKIALDVHDDDDDDLEDDDRLSEISNNDQRRYSIHNNNNNRQRRSVSPVVANGFDSNSEIEQYKAEIKRLQESESQIKALSVNYAALLKEREDRISRLNDENSSLKKNLEVSRSESSKTSANSPSASKQKNRSFGKRVQNGVISKEDASGNGVAHSLQRSMSQNKTGRSSTEGSEKELSDLLEEKSRSLTTMQSMHEQQIKQLREELDKERATLASLQLRNQEEQKLNRSLQEEQYSLKADKENMLAEMNKIRDELGRKSSEIRHLQMELNKKENLKATDVTGGFKRLIASLEKENSDLKAEKNELKVALEVSKKSLSPISNGVHEQVTGTFPGKEEMESSLQKLEKDLKETSREKDKALQQLNRLKQHLLEKESEDSEKMDEDSKIIEGLRENNEVLRAQIRHLEKSLNQAISGQEEVKMTNNNELQKAKEVIDDLNKKVASLRSTVDAKNVELLNLQTALGQYFAEIEAKGHLERELASAREESVRLSKRLEDALQLVETTKQEKEEALEKVSQAERLFAEGKGRVNKLEEDNSKLRRALEQSMTRLNRMSMDSDFSVDRRIVIKLLVTYFQRNHSKEVLDLMVRMLGFSEEEKQRIGVAQQGAGKGVVRGVFGLPGRLVGGILGGSPTENSGNMASDNQSFADMWVDFLLKEGEEREKRESSQNVDGAVEDTSPSKNNPSLQIEQRTSEFSTVPLASPHSDSRFTRQIPRY